MSTSYSVFFLVLVYTALSAHAALTQIDCSNLKLDGDLYDLSKLSNAEYPFAVVGEYGVYQFRVCSNFMCGSTSAAACLENHNGKLRMIGSFSDDTNVTQIQDGLSFINSPVLAFPAGPWFMSTINMYCDPNANLPYNINIAGSSEPNLMYFSLWHKSACRGMAGKDLSLPVTASAS